MGPPRTELMQFKVTPGERRLIEKCAKKRGLPFQSMYELPLSWLQFRLK